LLVVVHILMVLELSGEDGPGHLSEPVLLSGGDGGHDAFDEVGCSASEWAGSRDG
jgi:hypothetical protein